MGAPNAGPFLDHLVVAPQAAELAGGARGFSLVTFVMPVATRFATLGVLSRPGLQQWRGYHLDIPEHDRGHKLGGCATPCVRLPGVVIR